MAYGALARALQHIGARTSSQLEPKLLRIAEMLVYENNTLTLSETQMVLYCLPHEKTTYHTRCIHEHTHTLSLSTLDCHHLAMLGDGDTRHKHTYTHDSRFPSPCNARGW